MHTVVSHNNEKWHQATSFAFNTIHIKSTPSSNVHITNITLSLHFSVETCTHVM